MSAHPSPRLILLGFSDRVSDAAHSTRLSLERARLVGAELEKRGVRPESVRGLGASMPLSGRDDDAGRARHRRVEVWVAGTD